MADRHLYIAGTGRAGTTFLVRYLTEVGLETLLSRNPAIGEDEKANAGLEEPPHILDSPDLPYVVKSPWLYLVLDELLERGTFSADAVIIPVRDLGDAAASRLTLQHQSIISSQVWMTDLKEPWDVWATVPGGLIYSMHQVDAERVLAVGFHHLVERLTREDIPIVFLHFPRFVHDASYLYSRLKAVTPGLTEDTARKAFDRVAAPEKVRSTAFADGGDTLESVRLQNAALKRENAWLRQQTPVTEPVVEPVAEPVMEPVVAEAVHDLGPVNRLLQGLRLAPRT
jgi:hypothetical protein